ncbi:MAG: hypothetical protein AB8G77_07720 [Rhodothermales bacterium]
MNVFFSTSSGASSDTRMATNISSGLNSEQLGNRFNILTRVCGQLAGKRAFDGIFVQIKALFVFDAAHRAQKGTQLWAKGREMHFAS